MQSLKFEDVPGKWRCGHDYYHMRVTRISSYPMGPEVLLYVSNMQTDWDGAPNAYGPKHMHPKESIANAGPDPKKGWYGVVAMSPQEAAKKGFDLATWEKKDVHGRYPIIQSSLQPCPGMYVSKTSLPLPGKEGLSAEDQNRYPNAAEIPYGALSGGLKRCGCDLGDKVLSIRADRGNHVEYPFLDSDGGADKLAEVSKNVITRLGSSEHIACHLAFLGSSHQTVSNILNRLSYADNARDLPVMMACQLAEGPSGRGLERYERAKNSPAELPRALFEQILMQLWKTGYHF